jgi:hypothetical protein
LGQIDLASGQVFLALSQTDLAPGQVFLALSQTDLAPGQVFLALSQTFLAPGQVLLALGQTDLAPGQVFLALGQTFLASSQIDPASSQQAANTAVSPSAQRRWKRREKERAPHRQENSVAALRLERTGLPRRCAPRNDEAGEAFAMTGWGLSQ